MPESSRSRIRSRFIVSVTIQLLVVALVALVLYNQSASTGEDVQVERRVIQPDGRTVVSSARLTAGLPPGSSSSKSLPGVGSLDIIASLLERKEELELSQSQVSQLERLLSIREKAVLKLDQQIEEEVGKFNKLMHADGRTLSMDDVAREAGPSTRLGRDRRLLEEDYNRQGLALLTESQRGRFYAAQPESPQGGVVP